ncbi:MAG: glutaminase, partial [Stomatobaculum sp.]|nr:glutaminase [Stomatobaculum sp.]
MEKIDRIPSNPFINAGAISMFSCLPGNDVEDKYERFRAFAGSLLGNPRLDYSREVSRLGAVLAADGFDPVTKKQLISAKTSHTVRALIAGCG